MAGAEELEVDLVDQAGGVEGLGPGRAGAAALAVGQRPELVVDEGEQLVERRRLAPGAQALEDQGNGAGRSGGEPVRADSVCIQVGSSRRPGFPLGKLRSERTSRQPEETMRTPSTRLPWAALLLAALACSGESDPMAPSGGDVMAAVQAGARVISVSPSSNPVDFGTIQGPFGSATPTTKTFTVTNVGTKVTTGLAVSITGTGAAAYSIGAGDDGCSGRSLALSGKNKTCSVKLTFAPTAPGSFTAALNVTIAQPKALVSVSLSGTGADPLTVTIDQAAGQADPAIGTLPSWVTFHVVFSNPVANPTLKLQNFSGVSIGGMSLTPTGARDGTEYLIAVKAGSFGTLTFSMPAGQSTDIYGQSNAASTSTDNSVTVVAPLTVTINQASYQQDPAYGESQVYFEAVFSNPVTDFGAEDVAVSGVGDGASVVRLDDSYTRYQVVVYLYDSGVVNADILANSATDAYGQSNAASTSTDNSVDVTLGQQVECVPSGDPDPDEPICSTS
jgi:hypothetical protein